MSTPLPSLSALIESCAAEWARQGGELQSDGQIDLTDADCEWIVGQLGRKPTAEEWADEGYRFVSAAWIA